MALPSRSTHQLNLIRKEILSFAVVLKKLSTLGIIVGKRRILRFLYSITVFHRSFSCYGTSVRFEANAIKETLTLMNFTARYSPRLNTMYNSVQLYNVLYNIGNRRSFYPSPGIDFEVSGVKLDGAGVNSRRGGVGSLCCCYYYNRGRVHFLMYSIVLLYNSLRPLNALP